MTSRGPVSLAAALALIAGAATAAASPRAPGSGEIVFASDRATANPGEIYAITPAGARRNVTRSPWADVALATAPRGKAIAFWSNRTGPWRLMVAPDGGRALRTVVVAGAAGPESVPAPPVFSADGSRLLIPYLARDAIAQVPQYAVAGVRSGGAQRLKTDCRTAPALSPDGLLVACGLPGGRGLGRRPAQPRALRRRGHDRALVA